MISIIIFYKFNFMMNNSTSIIMMLQKGEFKGERKKREEKRERSLYLSTTSSLVTHFTQPVLSVMISSWSLTTTRRRRPPISCVSGVFPSSYARLIVNPSVSASPHYLPEQSPSSDGTSRSSIVPILGSG